MILLDLGPFDGEQAFDQSSETNDSLVLGGPYDGPYDRDGDTKEKCLAMVPGVEHGQQHS
jgi:hypothetical protein